MCVIFTCERNCRLTEDDLMEAYLSNPDGAGIAWCENNAIHVRKGLMTYEEMVKELEQVPADVPLMIHMRIATSGGINQEATHPFPISPRLSDMHKLSYDDGQCVLMHNGVLPYESDSGTKCSDSMTYTMKIIAPLAKNKTVENERGLIRSKFAEGVIESTCIDNRIALLDAAGDMKMFGDGWSQVTDGIWASNTYWRYTPVYKTSGYWNDDWNSYYSNRGYSDGLYSYGSYGGWQDDRWGTSTTGDDRYDELADYYGLDAIGGGTVCVDIDDITGKDIYRLPLDVCTGCPYADHCRDEEPECPEIAEWCEMNTFPEDFGITKILPGQERLPLVDTDDNAKVEEAREPTTGQAG